MRNYYCLLAATATLLLAMRAQAQQAWQPFRPGLTYQLSESATPGDTTHVLRLGGGAPVAGIPIDSLFRFNVAVGRANESRAISNCYSLQRLRSDNLFGATLRSQPRSVFVLAATNGRTLVLKPRAALGQSWATGLTGLSASVTSRAMAPVLGSAPDSVATITFSDGETLRLSKCYGLVEGPSLDSYLNGRNRRRYLKLTALPERHLGTAVTGVLAVFDYQPGDVFQYVSRYYNYTIGQYLCQQTWQQDSILTRQASRTGDTLTYTIRTRRRSQAFGVAGAPSNLCGVPVGSTILPPATRTLVIINNSATLPPLTSSFLPYSSSGATAFGRQTSAFSRSTRLAGRPEYSVRSRGTCNSISADSTTLTELIDLYSFSRYATGLGPTYTNSGDMFSETITELTAFRKGTQSWGTFFGPTVLLATREVRPAATTTVLPNPFGETLTASFVLTAPQAVGAVLYDALGRQVRALPALSLGSGRQQLALPTAGLPAAVYTLHLTFTGEGRQEVVKVVKAD